MKIKFNQLILVLFSLLIFTNNSYAEEETSVAISGTAYNEQIGLLHFNYSTAQNPDSDNPVFDDPKYYIGPKKQFYISPFDDSGAYTGPGVKDFVARISVQEDDCTVSGCLIKGFLWNDSIGWIALEGDLINSEIDDPGDGTEGDIYPPAMYPRIKTGGNTAGAITGYAWNEYAGWISFSSDETSAFGITTPTADQVVDNWGVWLDIMADQLTVTTDAGTEDELTTKVGRLMHGYAWSENLGWIKFNKTPGDTFDQDDQFPFEFFGPYTVWIPDEDPPVLLSANLVWFAVGVNTGNNTVPTTVSWDNFVKDDGGGINPDLTEINIEATDDSDAKCSEYVPIGGVIKNVADAPIISEGDVLNLTIPTIGHVKEVPVGFCKYRIDAKISDENFNYIYIGDKYLTDPEPLPDPYPVPEEIFDEIIVYVRAGDYDPVKSTVMLVPKSNNLNSTAAIADGKDFIKYEVDFKDIAENPIIDIDCSTPSIPDDPETPENEWAPNPQYQYSLAQGDPDDCPGRQVTLTAQITNQVLYDRFGITNLLAEFPTPVKHSDVNVGSSGETLLNTDTSIEINEFGLLYPLEISSYAPTTSYLLNSGTAETKTFQINQIDYQITNEPLPPIYIDPVTGQGDPATAVIAYSDPDPGPGQVTNGFVNPLIDFIRPVFTNNPMFIAGGLEDVATLSVPANLSFDVNNISSKSIAGAEGGGLSVETLVQYWSPTGNPSVALMETHNILNVTPGEGDGFYAWSDPFAPAETGIAGARYELYDGNYYDFNSQIELPQDALTSAFRYAYPFFFYWGIPYPNIDSTFYSTHSGDPDYLPPLNTGIRSDGTYALSGHTEIPQNFPYIGPPAPNEVLDNAYYYNPGKIDRNDPAELGLSPVSDPDDPANSSPGQRGKEIQFIVEKFVPVTIDDIKLKVVHAIAYRYPDQHLFTYFAEETPIVPGIDVKDIAAQAIGTVAGAQIVTGRKFDVVGTASTDSLQKAIRKNVAQMTSGIIAPCPVPASLPQFETSGSCIIDDPANNTKFAYYEGDYNDTLVLGTGAEGADIIAPDYPYTIIVRGGANILVKNNIIYPATVANSSLGIILIAENLSKTDVGKAANFYITPDPTNIVGVLYAEGSIMSRTRDNSAFYYGGASGNVTELANQLYWLGSIASRNSIAGAGRQPEPLIPAGIEEGVGCLSGDSSFNCAQRYDFDYLRRFTAVVAQTGESQIANDGKFSGGGCCELVCDAALNEGECKQGTIPSLVTIDANKHIVEADSELSPFFIQREPRTINNPPPGFTTSEAVESSQVIR
ncbi:hypothetical protein ACFL6I_24535 [candidate division KSB1 bacterium]